MSKRLSVLLCAIGFVCLTGCHRNNNTSGYGIGWVTLSENASAAPGTVAGVVGGSDFSSYLVTVDDITMTGSTVGAITAIAVPEVIDFTKLKNISELWAGASIPNDIYLSATITLDYTSANISVLVDGVPTRATVINAATGLAATTVSVTINFDPNNPPRIVATYASTNAIRLAVDVDLPASNTVSVVAGVPTVTVNPFFTISTSASDSKLIRVRGPLVNSSLGENTYSVYIRPFYDQVDSLGTLSIFNTANTIYSLDGVQYIGAPGLSALSQTSSGTTMTAAFTTFTPTVAQYTYAGIFHSVYVVAGSTLGDFYTDGLEGDVIARSGNVLTVRGATLEANAAEVVDFEEADSQVILGPNTLVTADGVTGLTGLSSQSISVGQHIIARGLYSLVGTTVTLDSTGSTATNTGSVRIQSTALWGTFVSAATGSLAMNLANIDGYPASVFNFAGTGATAAQDANAADYIVNTGALALPAIVGDGDPLWVDGYVSPFGAAPPDFNAFNLNAEPTVPATMIVAWTAAGTTAPFAPISDTGLTVDLSNPAFVSGVVRIGAESLDMKSLAASPQIVPLVGLAPGAGVPSLLLPVFGVGSTIGGINVFNTYADYVTKVNALLATATTAALPTAAVKFTATGTYNRGTNLFTASNINLVL